MQRFLPRPSLREPPKGRQRTFIPLALVSGEARSDWIYYSTNDNGDFYTDPGTVRRNGKITKLWTLLDQKNVDKIFGKDYLSSKSQFEFNCNEEQSRLVYILYY